MKSHNFIIALILGLCSCSSENSNVLDDINEESSSQEITTQRDIAGTWCYYSGTLNSFLSLANKDIYDINLELTPEGNIKETVINKSRDEEIKEASAYGNWIASNNLLTILNWDGDTVATNIPYSFQKDVSLTLDINGSKMVFMTPEQIKSKYGDLIVGEWDNGRKDSGRTRTVFYMNGEGFSLSEYYDNKFFGRDDFKWSIKSDTLIIHHTWIAGPTGINTNIIKFLNKKHLSWTRGKGSVCYTRE